jgi:hypothetical protein
VAPARVWEYPHVVGRGGRRPPLGVGRSVYPSFCILPSPFFGPIQAPPGKTIAGGRPAYFASGRLRFASGRLTQRPYVGVLVVMLGWYLETTVKLEGFEQRV